MSQTNKIRLTIELELDEDFGQNSKDESEREWFREHLLRDELFLHSNLVGATIGSVKVLSIEHPIADDSLAPEAK